MNTPRRHPLPPIAASLLAVFCSHAAAQSEDADTADLASPASTVEAGVGAVSKDNQRFGQYSGLKGNGGYGLLDLYLVKRDDASGTWLKLTGRNLGLDSRELRFEHERQGNWGYFIDYSQTPRYDPYTVSTRLTGVGSSSQAILGSPTAQEYHLKTERKALTFGIEKSFSPGLGLQLRYRDEDKDGARLYGQGTFTEWRFLTDPINQNTKQLDATLNYTTPRLQFSGGYYGTWFTNRNLALNVTGSIAGLSPVALPPGSDSHQLNLAGGYKFSDTIRGTFKIARARSTQTDVFPTTPVAASGASNNLQGRIDSTQLQAGLTARATQKLTLRADYRYDDRNDKTPVFRYWPSQNTATSTNDGTNEPRSIRTTRGKLEAGYRLPMGFLLTGGVDYEEKKRNSPPVRSVDFREKTDETTLRAELRRSVSETVTGAVSLLHASRGGSAWLPMVTNNGTTASAGSIAPLHLLDRDRDTLRMTVNWMPTDPLSLNLRADNSRDRYSGRGLNAFDIGQIGRASCRERV